MGGGETEMTQRIGSHWATCWKDSSKHWECAVQRVEQLEALAEQVANALYYLVKASGIEDSSGALAAYEAYQKGER